MTTVRDNVDPAELAKFDALASRWWDTEGDFRPLHEINPLRLDWIRQHVKLAGCRALDIGCGGGILAESMAAAERTSHWHRHGGGTVGRRPFTPARIRRQR